MHKFIIYDFIFCRDDIDAANIASWKFSYKQAEVEEGVKSVCVLVDGGLYQSCGLSRHFGCQPAGGLVQNYLKFTFSITRVWKESHWKV